MTAVCHFGPSWARCLEPATEPGSWGGSPAWCAEHKALLADSRRRRRTTPMGANPPAARKPAKAPRKVRAMNVARHVLAADGPVSSEEAYGLVDAAARSSAVKIVRMAVIAGWIRREGFKLLPGSTPLPAGA